METEETRALIERFIAARVTNDAAALETLFTDDVEWHLPVSASAGPFAGRDVVIEALTGGVSGKILDVSTMKREAWKVIVDGDTAAVQQRVSARTLQDTDYVNEYCWVYTCRDGKVARMVEYADTLNAARIFGFVKS
jgi:ketosteroid isomerase-like protein